MKGRGGQAGDHVAAHVSQADKVYSELIQSGVTVDGWRQSGETVYFRTPQPLPTHRRRSRWWVGSVGAVVAFFAVAGLLKAGVLAASVGVAMAGVLLFGGLFLLVWKISDRPGAGFIGTTIAGLVCAVLLIGALTSVEPMWDAGAAAQQASIAAECGGIGGGDIACRWQKLVESGERLAEVAQSPESEGLGTLLLGTLAVVIGGGWVCWKWMLR